MLRTAAVCGGALALLTVSGSARQSASIADLKTTAEASNFTSTSTYENVVGFMRTVANASPSIHFTTYGTTHEGREMPLAVVGTGLADASAAAVLATGKLRVHIQGNIHAGEVEGKEAAQILLREFALGEHADWLDSMVLLITPIFNADGNERFALNNRPRQNGPINGMGTRANAQGLNLNRDFMKLDTPEARAFVSLWNDFDPHVGLDLHTSDGSRHAYHLTYSPPLNPNTSDQIMDIMTGEWFPFITAEVREKYGWHMFYYGNVSGGARGRGGRGGRGGAQAAPEGPPPPQAWRTFEHVPRFHNNYVGLRNRFALLSEAYAYATFEDRITATGYFIEEALNFAHDNARRLTDLAAAADGESIVGRELGTRAAIATGEMVEILMGDVEDDVNPNNGAVMNRRLDVVRPEQMLDQLWFEPTATERVPSEFYVPANATAALELLRLHGIQMREVSGPISDLEHFRITSNVQDTGRGGRGRGGAAQGPRLFEGHVPRRLEGAWSAAGSAGFPDGAWAVSLDQPLGRLAFYLLAPTSDDGLLNWNALDEVLGDRDTYPVLRKR